MGTTRRSTGAVKKSPRAVETENEKRLRKRVTELEANLNHRNKEIERLNSRIEILEAANESWRRKMHDSRLDNRGMKL